MDASSSVPPIKDASLSLLNLGNLKSASPPSLRAQPKSDASLEVRPCSLSLTKEERTPVFAATKLANPDADCKAFNLVTYPKIVASLIAPGHVLYISCNYFFQTANDAKAVLAAGLQGNYWEMKARLFEEWGQLDRQSHFRIARDLGLNSNEFLLDYDSNAIARRAEDERRLGQSIGVKTTPTFLIGWQLSDGTFVGQRIRGPKPWTFFRERVERMRQLK